MPLSATGQRRDVEWRTCILAVNIYVGWLLLTWFHAAVPLWLLPLAGGWLVAWQSALQHETIHGHPTRWNRLNRLIGAPPLMLFLPYESYRMSHLMHHRDQHLTDPLEDPESYYWTVQDWSRLNGVLRWLVMCQTTLAGRLVLGPPWVAARFLAQEWAWICRGSRRHMRLWLFHALGVTLVLVWVCGICGMGFWTYLAAFVYPGTALVLMRSFAEHRARPNARERIAIVENASVFGLLYLHNNLHAAHHENPAMPWHEIPAWYRANRMRLLMDNDNLVYQGYGEIARRYLFTPHDQPVDPLGRSLSRKG